MSLKPVFASSDLTHPQKLVTAWSLEISATKFRSSKKPASHWRSGL
jgi:hypothetical protein